MRSFLSFVATTVFCSVALSGCGGGSGSTGALGSALPAQPTNAAKSTVRFAITVPKPKATLIYVHLRREIEPIMQSRAGFAAFQAKSALYGG